MGYSDDCVNHRLVIKKFWFFNCLLFTAEGCENRKKSLMLLGNVLIILVIMAFIMLYVSSERQKMLVSQTEAFKNMTVAMESVTTNYLVGEQQVCRSWSNYINASDMTAEDAINYVRKSLTAPEIMAHILFAGEDGLTGFSTAPKADGDYTVSYNDLDIFSNGFDDLLREKNKVNVTRAYINPINAIQSIGFCCCWPSTWPT